MNVTNISYSGKNYGWSPSNNQMDLKINETSDKYQQENLDTVNGIKTSVTL